MSHDIHIILQDMWYMQTKVAVTKLDVEPLQTFARSIMVQINPAQFP